MVLICCASLVIFFEGVSSGVSRFSAPCQIYLFYRAANITVLQLYNIMPHFYSDLEMVLWPGVNQSSFITIFYHKNQPRVEHVLAHQPPTVRGTIHSTAPQANTYRTDTRYSTATVGLTDNRHFSLPGTVHLIIIKIKLSLPQQVLPTPLVNKQEPDCQSDTPLSTSRWCASAPSMIFHRMWLGLKDKGLKPFSSFTSLNPSFCPPL